MLVRIQEMGSPASPRCNRAC